MKTGVMMPMVRDHNANWRYDLLRNGSERSVLWMLWWKKLVLYVNRLSESSMK